MADDYKRLITESVEDIEYQLMYEEFLAEYELYTEMVGCIQAISENTDILNESVKETVMNYLTKIRNVIQQTWQHFKMTIDEKQKERLAKLKDPIAKCSDANVDFTVKNFYKYDFTKFEQLKVAQWQEDMKDHCETENEFIKTYYPGIELEKHDNNLKKAVDIFLGGEKVPEQTVRSAELKEYFDFCSNKYYEMRDRIETDINVTNKSADDIERLVSAAQDLATEAMTLVNQALLDVITEADGDNNNEKPAVVDNSGEAAPSDATPEEKKAYEKSSMVNVATMYFKTGTKILSAKMKALNNARSNYMLAINYFADKEHIKVATDKANEVKNKAKEAADNAKKKTEGARNAAKAKAQAAAEKARGNLKVRSNG